VANLTSGVSGLGASFWRAKRLNCDGTVVDTLDDLCETAGYASCKFTEITRTPVVLEGETFQERTAGGQLCVNVETDPITTGYTYTLALCDVDYEAKEILGVVDTLIVNGTGDTIGAELKGGAASCACGSTTVCRQVAFEFWVKAYRCSELVGYIRTVIPSITFTEGTDARTYSNSILLETFTGQARANTDIPATGPWADAPAGVALTGNAPAEFFEATIPAAVSDAAELGTYIPCDYTGESSPSA
jgi:hypothetical protein